MTARCRVFRRQLLISQATSVLFSLPTSLSHYLYHAYIHNSLQSLTIESTTHSYQQHTHINNTLISTTHSYQQHTHINNTLISTTHSYQQYTHINNTLISTIQQRINMAYPPPRFDNTCSVTPPTAIELSVWEFEGSSHDVLWKSPRYVMLKACEGFLDRRFALRYDLSRFLSLLSITKNVHKKGEGHTPGTTAEAASNRLCRLQAQLEVGAGLPQLLDMYHAHQRLTDSTGFPDAKGRTSIAWPILASQPPETGAKKTYVGERDSLRSIYEQSGRAW